MHKILPSKAMPSVPWQARHADSDYGVSDEPDWRQVDWASHLHRVEVGQDSLTYVDLGEGEGNPVVFVHGLGGQWQNFIETLPRIAQERRMMERPRAVNDVVLEFLAETGAAEERETVDAASERR